MILEVSVRAASLAPELRQQAFGRRGTPDD